MISSRTMGWKGHVALMGAKKNAYKDFGGEAGRKETTRKT
jgi:hypothetical protein